jgi:hypothetical protein
MRRFLLTLLTLVPLLASAKPATELAGRYVLQGARDTGSTLLLKDDGRFAATFAYGNLDGHIQGHWQRVEDRVTLTADGLRVDNACLYTSLCDYL